MRQQTIFLAMALLVVSGPSVANNGVTTSTFVIPQRFYVPCLGEELVGEAHVTATGHVFTTPSGNFHVVDNWKATIVVSGTSSGNTWVATPAPAPFVFNDLKQHAVQFFVQNVQWVPLDEGPKILQNVTVQIRFDDEGNMVSSVHVANGTSDDSWRCVGKK